MKQLGGTLRVRTLGGWIASAALVAAPVMIVAGCGGNGAEERIEVARPAKIFTVRSAGEGNARVFPGQVRAAKRVPLSFRVGGPVVDLAVSKGQHVAKGALLARIDPRDYEVEVKNLEAQLAEKRAQLSQASEEYRRVRGLYQHDNASKSDFDRARAEVDVGEAQVASTEQALRAPRLALSDAELRAPFDGIVADRLVDAHQVVAAGQPVLLFQDVRGLEVLIDVPERDVTALTGQEPKAILIRFDALPEERYSARVKEFATETDAQTGTFPVTLQIEQSPATNLLPGMTASAAWHTANGDGRDATIVVPFAAVVAEADGSTFVWRVDPDTMRVARIPVVTGSVSDDGYEVVSGLAPGDRVLAAGAHFVSDGQLVRPIGG